MPRNIQAILVAVIFFLKFCVLKQCYPELLTCLAHWSHWEIQTGSANNP